MIPELSSSEDLGGNIKEMDARLSRDASGMRRKRGFLHWVCMETQRIKDQDRSLLRSRVFPHIVCQMS